MLNFLKQYQAWLDAGAPQGEPFSRKTGLCINILLLPDYALVRSELRTALFTDFQDTVYPFNNGRSSGFIKEMQNGSAHRNKARNAWVKKMINES